MPYYLDCLSCQYIIVTTGHNNMCLLYILISCGTNTRVKYGEALQEDVPHRAKVLHTSPSLYLSCILWYEKVDVCSS